MVTTVVITVVPIAIFACSTDWYSDFINYVAWMSFARLMIVAGALNFFVFFSVIFKNAMKNFLRYEYLKLRWVFRIQNVVVLTSLFSMAEILYMFTQYY